MTLDVAETCNENSVLEIPYSNLVSNESNSILHEGTSKFSLEGISVMKGFLLICVILIHLFVGDIRYDFYYYFLYSFTVPLFLACSGYMLNQKFLKNTSFVGIWKKSDVLFMRHVELGIISGLLGQRTVVELHVVININKQFYLRVLAFLAKRLNIVCITVTQGAANRLMSMGVNEKKILVAPSAVNMSRYDFSASKTDLRQRLGLNLDKPFLVLIQRL